MMTSYTIINDGQMEWVAETAALIRAMDDLGWEETRRLGLAARVEPESDEDYEAYAALCAAVPAVEIEPADQMRRLAYYPAEGAWLWDR